MATHNGARYLRRQLESILAELGANDELVVCDDASTDDTAALLESYHDARIRLLVNPKNLGHVRAFERALQHASGRFIALSDQDDIWIRGRLASMKAILEEDPSLILVVSNFRLIDEQGKPVGEFGGLKSDPRGALGRIAGLFLGKVPYFGCTFLMRRELAAAALPIPRGIESHDIWMGLIANSVGKVHHLAVPTLERRLHGGNVTPRRRRGLAVILWRRLLLLLQYLWRVSAIRLLGARRWGSGAQAL